MIKKNVCSPDTQQFELLGGGFKFCLVDSVSASNGFVQYWDSVANAPCAFNPLRKIEVPFDDSLSITRKTQYVITKRLGGIMFWQLMDDQFSNGLLDLIDKTKEEFKTNLTPLESNH